MALLMTEGFDWLQLNWNNATMDTTLPEFGWSPIIGGRTEPRTGRFGGYSLYGWGYVGPTVAKSFSSTGGSERIYCGFGGYPEYHIDGAGLAIILSNGTGGAFVECKFVDGRVIIYDSNYAVVGRSSSGWFVNESWFYAEVFASYSTTNGSVVVRINGVEVVSLSGVKTARTGTGYVGYFDTLTLNSDVQGYYGAGRWDDIYVCDESPGGPAGFLGPVRVQTLFPNGPGDSTQFEPSNTTVENWQLASNPNANDATFVYGTGATSGAYDLYTAQDVPDTSVVFGVKPMVINRMSDGAPPQLLANTAIKTNGSTVFGTDKNATASYKPKETVYGLNPVTGSSWTPVDVNAIQFGPKQG